MKGTDRFSVSTTLAVVLCALAVSPVAYAQRQEEIDLAGPENLMRTYSVGSKIGLTLVNANHELTYRMGKVTLQAKAPTAQCLLTLFKAEKESESEIKKHIQEAPEACKDDDSKKEIPNLGKITLSGGYEVAESFDEVVEISRAEGAGLKTWRIRLITDTLAATQLTVQKQNERVAELRERVNQHSSLISRKCDWDDAGRCNENAVFVNADYVSSVSITGVPTNATTVRVTAGELHPCRPLGANVRTFKAHHGTVVVPLHMTPSSFANVPLVYSGQRKESLSLYGMSVTKDIAGKLRFARQGEKSTEDLDKLKPEQVESACENSAPFYGPAFDTSAADSGEVPTVPLVVRGRSELLTIEFSNGLTHLKTFSVPIRYQRFWLDAGGFFAFSRLKERELISRTLEGGRVLVEDIRINRTLKPLTGIVLNIHPGNYPQFAAQFGITTSADRLPSYYLGAGARMRELGKRGLATFAAGIVAVQSREYPGLVESLDYAGDSKLLDGRNEYDIQPYFSISLGFSFGGVNDGGNVASLGKQRLRVVSVDSKFSSSASPDSKDLVLPAVHLIAPGSIGD